MRNTFDRQLSILNNELIEMGSMIEKAIETLCLKLLLQQQPVARDLRLISSALKMITDMERIGDHATNISDWVIFSITGNHQTV